jgi:hypothetical protein
MKNQTKPNKTPKTETKPAPILLKKPVFQSICKETQSTPIVQSETHFSITPKDLIISQLIG